MSFRIRPMQLGDIREWVEIVASDPLVAPRYGPAIKLLPQAMEQALASEAVLARVTIAVEPDRDVMCCVGISSIVSEDFVDELKRPPHFWIGAELTRRIARGESPLLTAKQLRKANAHGGLTTVIWEVCTRAGYEFSNELLRFNMAGFVEMHRGFLFKEIISPQHHTAEHLAFVLGTGGRLWDPETGDYTLPLREDPAELIRKPHIIGVTRDMVDRRDRAASWVGSVFDYHSPILRFSPSEQRLLTCALTGVTDEQLAGALGISVSGVKKIWISIHRRVEESMPDLIPESHSLEIPTNSRGKEKRRRLLAYLRDHPEELRPASANCSGNNPTRAGKPGTARAFP